MWSKYHWNNSNIAKLPDIFLLLLISLLILLKWYQISLKYYSINSDIANITTFITKKNTWKWILMNWTLMQERWRWWSTTSTTTTRSSANPSTGDPYRRTAKAALPFSPCRPKTPISTAPSPTPFKVPISLEFIDYVYSVSVTVSRTEIRYQISIADCCISQLIVPSISHGGNQQRNLKN